MDRQVTSSKWVSSPPWVPSQLEYKDFLTFASVHKFSGCDLKFKESSLVELLLGMNFFIYAML